MRDLLRKLEANFKFVFGIKYKERLGGFMKMFFHQSSNDSAGADIIVDCQKMTLREELAQTRYALEIAYSNFDNVTDPDLIDCYIYEVNATLKRYKYLIEQAADLNLLPEDQHHEVYRALSLFS